MDEYQKRMVALRQEADMEEVQFLAVEDLYEKMWTAWKETAPPEKCDDDIAYVRMLMDRRNGLKASIKLLRQDADLIQELRDLKLFNKRPEID